MFVFVSLTPKFSPQLFVSILFFLLLCKNVLDFISELPTVIVVRILAGEDVDVSLAGGHEGGPSHAGQDCEEC